ncbi:hypothetical protein ACVGW4_12145, partial [Enterobacter hormaechei]
RELSECGAAVSPSPGGAWLSRAKVGGSFMPGKANPPPGTNPLSKHHHRPPRQPCRKGAKIIAATNMDNWHLLTQRFFFTVYYKNIPPHETPVFIWDWVFLV